MSTRQLGTITLVAILGATALPAQGARERGGKGVVAVAPTLATLVETHDGLASRFRQLSAAATRAGAPRAARRSLASFVRAEIVPQLEIESVVLYPVFDSIAGGGYAVPATLFDLDAIGFLVKEIERTAGTADRAAFEARAYALSHALEAYFTKLQLLVVPVLHERLGEPALRTMLARLETGRNHP
jgi:hypothetical protein